MKKIKFCAVCFIVCSIIIFTACDSGVKDDWQNVFKEATESDLVEKYDLIWEGGIWNDYMPSEGLNEIKSKSVCYVALGYKGDNLPYNGKPVAEMLVKIVTETKNFVRMFTYIEGANYRPTENFRLDDRENYTMYVTIKIGNEKQTITLTGTVFTTW